MIRTYIQELQLRREPVTVAYERAASRHIGNADSVIEET